MAARRRQKEVLAQAIDFSREEDKTSWTLGEVMKKRFPKKEFIVDQIIVKKGMNLLVAAPKTGKSFFLADLIVYLLWGLAPFGIGKAPTGDCDILLLTPDDPSMPRLKERIQDITQTLNLDEGDRVHQLYIEEEWTSIENGGIDELDEWLDEHLTVKVILIDTLSAIRDGNARNWQKADEDAMKALKRLAHRRGVTILATHHDRKDKDSGTGDVLDIVNGSRKITGGTDGILILQRARTKKQGKLHVITRDADDAEYHVTLDHPLWTIGPKVHEGNPGKTRAQEILDVLMQCSDSWLTVDQIWARLVDAGTTMPESTVGPTLSRMNEVRRRKSTKNPKKLVYSVGVPEA